MLTVMMIAFETGLYSEEQVSLDPTVCLRLASQSYLLSYELSLLYLLFIYCSANSRVRLRHVASDIFKI